MPLKQAGESKRSGWYVIMRIRVRQPYSACKPSKKALFKWASSTLQNNAFLLEKGKIFVAFRFDVVLSHFVLTFPTNRFADYR